jgi:hypothetical protein
MRVFPYCQGFQETLLIVDSEIVRCSCKGLVILEPRNAIDASGMWSLGYDFFKFICSLSIIEEEFAILGPRNEEFASPVKSDCVDEVGMLFRRLLKFEGRAFVPIDTIVFTT